MSEIDWKNQYSDDEIEQAFNEAFERPAKFNDVSTWEAIAEWEDDELVVNLEVTSMAGDLTKDQFEENEELNTIDIRLFDGIEVQFETSEVLTINGTDYRAIYVPAEEEDGDELEYDDLDVPDEDVLDNISGIEEVADLTGNTNWDDIGE